MVRFLDDVANGDAANKWIGIVSAANTLGSLAGKVGGVVNSLGNFNMDSTQGAKIDANLTTCIADIDSIYSTYSAMTVPRGDPSASPNIYTPDFISV